MKRIIAAIATIVSMGTALGQQRPQYTQYMINPFLVNPAVSGSEDYVDIKAGYRNQWLGMEGAPTTMFLSAHAPLGKGRVMASNRSRNKKNGWHGIGAIVTNDKIGPSTNSTFSASYSYHLKLSKDVVASLGVLAGLQSYSIDRAQLTTVTGGDGSVAGISGSSLADVNTGAWVYSKAFYAGLSMVQVVPQGLYNTSQAKGHLAQHFFLMGGYRYVFGYDGEFTFIPSAVMKIVYPAPIAIDLNAKLKYRDFVWGAVSYRRTDAVALLAGVLINKTFELSYSYDINTSSLRRYNGGSHEVVLGYRIPLKSNIICPSNFW